MQTPPTANRHDTVREHHGDAVVDPYAWLENAENSETIDYLKAENAYTESMTEHLKPLRESIFDEIKRRTQETDLSVPVRKGDWWTYNRTMEGKQYPIHCRVKANGDTPPELSENGSPLPGEEIVLDQNVLAEGHDFFSLGVYDFSVDGNVLAYGVDFAGNERFTLRFRDLRTGDDLSDSVLGVFYGGAWSADGEYFFYSTVDDAWRPHQVWRHRLGSSEDDVLVFEETDERFWCGVELSRSEKYLFCESHSKITSEVRFLAADDPTGEFVLFGHGRRTGIELSIDHQGDRFIVLHNEDAPNFVLGYTPVTDTTAFTELVPHRDDTRLESVAAFDGYLAVSLRRNGLTGIRIVDNAGAGHDLAFDEVLYSVSPMFGPEYHATSLRLSYQSMVSPDSVYDYDIAGRELLLRKQKAVLGGYDPAAYQQHRLWATASDGTQVPISIVARADVAADGSAPCLLYGYGSYETSIDPYFSIPRLSLLDRGVVYAIAHVRGGGEMGRHWYEDGKLLNKKNTFTDFVSCADHMVESGWSAPDKLVARGGSAGGLLMGAVANLAPSRFAGICAQVPFVDSLNTILDPTKPLTVIEWDEWGDPLHDADVYAYMKSYAPYENVADVAYPPILSVTSLNDTRVGFHEPAKWTARLRHDAQGGPFLLKTEMEAGHGGRSGRYDAWHEEAFNLAWTLDLYGLRE
ncbi:S9 family peptidase [Stackebrandtia soli]|uniref:S9 family peptidase n=1 Tax=Stackebrandtia soli TaxID=1892856 RepID=UPI0039E836C7